MATGEEPPPRTVVTSKPYEKDAKRARSRGKDMARLVAIVEALRDRRPLDPRNRDHALVGDWRGYRDILDWARWRRSFIADRAGDW